MKTNSGRNSLAAGKPCRAWRAKLEDVKNGLLRERSDVLREQGALFHSALNEAEALAWQTPFPHLVFPVLAQEKVSSVDQWLARQRRVRQETLAFAA